VLANWALLIDRSEAVLDVPATWTLETVIEELNPRHAVFAINLGGIEETNYCVAIACLVNIRNPEAVIATARFLIAKTFDSLGEFVERGLLL
jgi:hypothetical protein